MSLTAIIIPCYNEEKRLDPAGILAFLRDHPYYHFIFVDDGSTDGTLKVIDALITLNNCQVSVLELTPNQGKAGAVRAGFLFCIEKELYSFIGYWDADLSTEYEEMLRLTGFIIEQELDFVFGSRIKKLNTTITRSGFRHLSGRIITTMIDSYFNLGIYDTQCGAKIFSLRLAKIISQEPFCTNWLFDVEIFLRIRENRQAFTGEEVPLLKWASRPGSKINILSSPHVLFEFFNLIRTYSRKPSTDGQ